MYGCVTEYLYTQIIKDQPMNASVLWDIMSGVSSTGPQMIPGPEMIPTNERNEARNGLECNHWKMFLFSFSRPKRKRKKNHVVYARLGLNCHVTDLTPSFKLCM